jgi:O-antigen ligase
VATYNPWARAGLVVLVGAVAVVPWIFTTRLEDAFYLPKLVALWLILVVLCWLAVLSALMPGGGGFRLQVTPLVDGGVVAFVMLNVVAFWLSTDRHQSLVGERLQHQGLLTLLLYGGFFYLARGFIRRPGSGRAVLGAAVVGATAVAGYALAQAVGVDPIWHGFLPSGRVFSTIGQPNALAAYLVMAIPFALALGAMSVGAVRAAAWSSAGAMGFALVLTSSRGGLVGVVVAVAVFAVSVLVSRRRPDRSERGGRRRQAVVVAVGAAVVVIGLAVPQPRAAAAWGWDRVTDVRTGSSSDSTSSHLAQWRVAVKIIQDHPLLGTGPETFPEQFPRYSRMVLSAPQVRMFDLYRVESPHNTLLWIAAGAGLPALGAYLWIIGAVGVVVVRALRAGPSRWARFALAAILAVMAAHVVTDAFMSPEVTSSWLSWVLMGVAVSIARAPGRLDPQPASAS